MLLLALAAGAVQLTVAHASPVASSGPSQPQGAASTPSLSEPATSATPTGGSGTDASKLTEPADGVEAPPPSEGGANPGSPPEPASGGAPPSQAAPDTPVSAPAYPSLPEPAEPVVPPEPAPEEVEVEVQPLLSPDGAGEALVEPPLFSLAKGARSGRAEPKRGTARPADIPDDPGTLCPPDAPACQEAARAYGDFVRTLDHLIASCPPSLAMCKELAADGVATPEQLEGEFQDLVAECIADPEFCAEFAPVLAELTGVLAELAATCQGGAAACQAALCQDLDLDGCPREGRPRDRPRGSPRPSPNPHSPRLAAAVPASFALVSSGASPSPVDATSSVATSEVTAAAAAKARTSRLPFTGFPALALALLGLGLSLAGAGLLRRYS